VVVRFGDWSNRDVAGIIKKSPAGPVKASVRFCSTAICFAGAISDFGSGIVSVIRCSRRVQPRKDAAVSNLTPDNKATGSDGKEHGGRGDELGGEGGRHDAG
jgi:hypothetical protein